MKFVEDDISKSSLPDNSFDIIVSWETLEHIINVDSALESIKRILKPRWNSVYTNIIHFSV